jgi:hypothetical protein
MLISNLFMGSQRFLKSQKAPVAGGKAGIG